MAVLHRYHSRDWHQYLQSKIPLSDESYQEIMGLPPGAGLVFCARHQVRCVNQLGGEIAVGVSAVDAEVGENDGRAGDIHLRSTKSRNVMKVSSHYSRSRLVEN